MRSKNDPNIVISEDEVEESLNKIKARKAGGPDNVCGMLLKSCRKQLTPILTRIFQLSVNAQIVPIIWKTAKIVPVPKSSLPKCKNDLRPVALTSIIMKTFERVILGHLLPQVKPYMDSLQFAYSEKLGVDDAVLTLLHILQEHLDKLGTKARLLFIDFSSAFNTIQPHLLMNKLMNMNVNANLIVWIHSFLSKRLQYVNFNGTMSNVIEINTGAPQGCVLSAVLFIIYTSDCRSSSKHVIVKYADDTVILGLISNDEDVTTYTQEVDCFVDWCDNNFLNLNVKKTKEMIVDFSKSPNGFSPVNIKGDNVDIVDEYKYLGNIIDNKLKGNLNVSNIYKKCNQRMYFLRKLKNVKVDGTILTLFYYSIIQSVLSFCISSWFGACTKNEKDKLSKIVKCAKRLGCNNIKSMEELYNDAVNVKREKIMKNENHPLYSCFQLLPHGVRLNVHYSRTDRPKDGFVANAINLFNN